MEPVHPVIVVYRDALRSWMDAAERARLDALDITDTHRGDAHALAWLAADRAVRALAPLALLAAGLAIEAARLLRLPPVEPGPDLDARVTQALQALEPTGGWTAAESARSALHHAASRPEEAARCADACAYAAVRLGADRASVVSAAFELLLAMTAVARG